MLYSDWGVLALMKCYCVWQRGVWDIFGVHDAGLAFMDIQEANLTVGNGVGCVQWLMSTDPLRRMVFVPELGYASLPFFDNVIIKQIVSSILRL